MPEMVASLKKQNDALKAEIDSLQKNFDKLQNMFKSYKEPAKRDYTAADSSTVPKYPQVSLVKILGVGCYFRDCEIRTRKVANSLEIW